MKIYVASSWRNDYQPAVVEELRKAGHEVYDFKNPEPRTGFRWSDIDPEWKDWTFGQYKAALEHETARAGFASDFNAMQKADACVLVLPCNRSAHLEAGWMKGAGKRTFIYMPESQEPELMYRMCDGIFDDLGALISCLSVCTGSNASMLDMYDGNLCSITFKLPEDYAYEMERFMLVHRDARFNLKIDSKYLNDKERRFINKLNSYIMHIEHIMGGFHKLYCKRPNNTRHFIPFYFSYKKTN